MRKEYKRVITVLLTRYRSIFANFIYWISGRGYTHASLGLDDWKWSITGNSIDIPA